MIGGYLVEVDWNGNGTFGTGTSTENISSFVMSAEWTRGRDYASQLIGRTVSGKLTVLLKNTDDRFSPSNVATATNPITSAGGTLTPGRKVRLRANSGEFAYEFPVILGKTLWQGFLRDITPFPKVKGVNRAVLVAVGPLAHISEKPVGYAYTAAAVPLGTAVDNILDDAGWGTAAEDRDIDDANIQTTLTHFALDRQQPIDALREMEDTESGFVRETTTGGIGFDGRHTRLVRARSTTAQAIFTDEPTTGTLSFHVVVQDSPSQQVFTEVWGTFQPVTTAATSTLWKGSETGTDSTPIHPLQTLTYFIHYPNPSSPSEAWGVAEWVTPTATTDWNVFSDQDGTGHNYNGNIKQTTTKFFDMMKVELQMTSNLDGFVTFIQGRGVALNKGFPMVAGALDGVAAATYGARTYINRSKHLPNSETLRAWVAYTLSSYGTPSNVLQIGLPANRSALSFSQAVSLDLGDRVTIQATGNSGLRVDEDFFVEAVQHSVNSRRTHATTFKVSPVTALSGFWVLGVSKLGTSTKLAY
jgi:hypothetical protein